MVNMETKNYTFSLDQETVALLKAHGERQKLSMSSALRLLINRYCKGDTQC